MQILSEVSDFLDGLSNEDAAKITAHIKSLEADATEGLTIKPIKGKIKELIVRQYRIVFFKIGAAWYVVDAFRKQSKKMPKRIIERAEKIYKELNRQK